MSPTRRMLLRSILGGAVAATLPALAAGAAPTDGTWISMAAVANEEKPQAGGFGEGRQNLTIEIVPAGRGWSLRFLAARDNAPIAEVPMEDAAVAALLASMRGNRAAFDAPMDPAPVEKFDNIHSAGGALGLKVIRDCDGESLIGYRAAAVTIVTFGDGEGFINFFGTGDDPRRLARIPIAAADGRAFVAGVYRDVEWYPKRNERAA